MWYKDAIIYQLHVRSFHDANRDGIGDFAGLTEKLEYLRELGVTAIWLLPFYPSPLKDDGYDIAEYKSVNPIYGTLDDFKVFIDLAHRLGLRVITELVINHTSDQHPWFQRARRAPAGSVERDFYVWSDTQEKYKDARIIFKDFELSNWTWDPVAKAYFWHRFYSHQPDLNFDNPAVHEGVFDALDFWFELGVDGMRLDAVPYLYEREGTSCENLPETHAFLRKLRAHVDTHHRDKMLLAEANQWPEDTVPYFGNGDECHMCFHFPLMPRMFMSLQMEDRFPVVDILGDTPEIPENCQWAIFLRNHDELTLEMVTEEERDYMWRIFAAETRAKINLGIRRRLASLLRNDRKKIELLNALLFSLPGTPVVYYGDEIGMGDNIYLGDRNGVRTPMQWSADRNGGFSKANPQQLFSPLVIDLEFHFEAINVETQEQNPNSLLWWMKRIIALRRSSPPLCRGRLRMLHPDNPRVLCFLRESERETVLVVANTSRNVQYVKVMLPEFVGVIPREMFGGTKLPPIANEGVSFTFGPHQFYWFVLRRSQDEPEHARPLPHLRMSHPDADLDPRRLERVLPSFLASRSWFQTPESNIRGVDVSELVALPSPHVAWRLLLAVVTVHFFEGESRCYALPLALTFDSVATLEFERDSESMIALVARDASSEKGVLVDALASQTFRELLLNLLVEEESSSLRRFGLVYRSVSALDGLPTTAVALDSSVPSMHTERQYGHATLVGGDKLVIKFLRRVEEGLSPEVEVGLQLLRNDRLCGVPRLHGYYALARRNLPDLTLAIVRGYVPNKRNLWEHTLDTLGRYFEAARTMAIESPQELQAHAIEILGPFLPEMRRLAERIADLHRCLADLGDVPAFTPESPEEQYRRSLFQSVRQKLARVSRNLADIRRDLPDAALTHAGAVSTNASSFIHQIKRIIPARDLATRRIRVHGDLHLGNVLFTGKDFVVTNFEGDTAASTSVRRLKRSPMFDVARLLRSFDRATERILQSDAFRPEDQRRLEPWTNVCRDLARSAFLEVYLARLARPDLIPPDYDGFTLLFTLHYTDHLLEELLENPARRERLTGKLSALARMVRGEAGIPTPAFAHPGLSPDPEPPSSST